MQTALDGTAALIISCKKW